MILSSVRSFPFSALCRGFACVSLLVLLAASASAQTILSPTDGSTPSGLAPGSPAGSYGLGNFDTVNPYNGALNFRLPLLKVGGRGSAGFQITLPIQQKWVVNKSINPGYAASFYAEHSWWSMEDMTAPYASGRLHLRRGRSEQYDLRCTPGNYIPRETLTRLTFTAPDGTEYELRDQQTDGQAVFPPCDTNLRGFNRGKVFVTADGTSATFVSDEDIRDVYRWEDDSEPTPSGYLMFKDGTRFRIDGSKISWMRDRNGNLVTFGYDIYQRLSWIKDSLNRQVTITYANPNTGVTYDEISYAGFGGEPRSLKLGKAALLGSLRDDIAAQPATALFPELSGKGSTVYSVYNYVELPDGSQYRLRYNRYGELARVELPTGGAVEYDYAAGLTDGYADGLFVVNGAGGTAYKKFIYRRLVERRLYPDGATGSGYQNKMVYSRPETQTTNTGYVVAEQCTPGGTTGHCGTGPSLLGRSYHYFYGSPRASFLQLPTKYASWREGREYRTEVYDPQTGTLLRRTDNLWQQPPPGATWPLTQAETNDAAKPNSPQVTQTLTTLADTNQVGGQSFAYDQYGNQTDVYEYDFGAGAAGALVRRSHTDFVTDGAYVNADVNNPALGAHLRGLPWRKWVSTDAAGANKVSLSVIEYDNYGSDSRHAPLLSRPSITGLCDAVDAQRQCVLSNPAALAPRGNATGVTTYEDAAAQTGAVTASTQYDVAGNAVKSVDARGGVSEVFFDDSFCNGSGCGGGYTPNTYAFPTSTKSPKPDPQGTYGSAAELYTSTVYDFQTGLAYSTTDANDKTTTLSYTDEQGQLDPLGRPRKVTRPDGGWTRYDYGRNQFGDYVGTRVLQNDSGAVAESFQYYDGLGRPYRSLTYENQEPAAPWITSDTEYDELGRVKRVSFPYRSSGSGQAAFSGGKWAETAYDSLGRVKTVTTRPDAAVVSTSYDGDKALVTDQAGRKRLSRSDALGRLREVWEIAPADASTVSVTFLNATYSGYQTSYVYDALDNLRQVQQGGQRRYFMYDSLGRLTRARNPEQAANNLLGGTDPVTNNAQWSDAYAYDANGNLATRTDARGVVTTYGYDALNRNTTVRYADAVLGAGNHTKDIDRHYDGAVNGKGRFWYFNWDWPNNARFDTHLAIDEYDEVGRPKKHRQRFLTNGSHSPDFVVTRAYDKAGHVKTQTYPSGHTVAYNYDALGRPGDSGGQPAFGGNLGDGVSRTYAAAVTYGEYGRIQQERFGTQTPLYRKLHYNSRAQLCDIRLSTHSLQADEWDWNRGALVNYYGGDYQWCGAAGSSGSATDNNGNLRRSEHWIPNDDQISSHIFTRHTYEYDALNRLASVAETAGVNSVVNSTPFVQAYDYDRWGNRTVNLGLSSNAPAAQYGFESGDLQHTNRLHAPGDLAYPDPNDSRRRMRYDAAGNLAHDSYTGDGARAYDAENRMTAAYDKTGNWASYAYDAEGRRVKRRTAYEETWQLYGMDGELLAEYRAGAAPFLPSKEYGYRGGELLVTLSSGDDLRLRRFVKNLYYNALARDPSAAEMQQRSDELAQAGAQGEPQLLGTARSIARGLFLSAEYAARGRTDTQYVTDLYHSYLQRGPDTPGLNYWVQNTQTYGRGTTLDSFEVCTEFATLAATVYGTAAGGENQRVETFVRNFYFGAMQREPTAAEMQQQSQRLDGAAALGQLQVVAEAQAMGGEIFQATNYNSGGTDQEYVTDLYEAFLQRAPDGPGLNHWVNHVQAHGRASAVTAFQQATEYRELAGTLHREAYWLVSDHLGTPRILADRTGSLAGVRRRDYLPFGEEVGAGVGGRTPARGYVGNADRLRQRYTSKERDDETGLDFFGARYYSSVQGRFTSVDPIKLTAERLSDPQRLNLYEYCRDNPLKYIDPDGEDLVLANAGARARFRQVVAPGLTRAERRNLRIVGNQVRLRNPNLRGSSPAYSHLTEVIGNSNLTVNYYAVAQGQTVTTATGATATYQNAVDAHGLTTGNPGDSVRDVIVPVGGSTPVAGTPARSGNTTPMPEDVIFAHEAYGHALDNDAVQVENEYRANRNPALPARSGEDHAHEVTVTGQPEMLPTETTTPATQIIPRPLIPVPPSPPPPPQRDPLREPR